MKQSTPPLFYKEKAIFLGSLPISIAVHSTSALHLPTPHLKSYLQHYQLESIVTQHCHTYHIWQSVVNTPEDSYSIVQQYWQSKKDPAVGTLVIAHGYLDHTGLYGRVIEWGLQQGYNVFCFDLPGHGLSSGDSALIHHFDTYSDILEKLLTTYSSSMTTSHHSSVEQPSRLQPPYIAIGQSTGGAIIANQLLRKRTLFEKVILLAPLVRSYQWGWLRYVYQILKPFTANIRRKFVCSSHNETFNRFLAGKDPLQARRIPLAWLGAMEQWHIRCKTFSSDNDSPPVTIIQGKEDTTVDWKYNTDQLCRIFKNARIYYIDGAKHHLVNESDEYWCQVTAYLRSL